jgi:phosphatidate cytidylyltransferase
MLSRSLTVLIAAPLVLALIGFMGPGVFFTLVLAVGLTALYEFYGMVLPRAARAELFGGLALGALVMTAAWADALSGSTGMLTAGTCIAAFMLIFTGYICLDRSRNVSYARVSRLFFGVFYVGLLFSFLILVRGLPHGIPLIFFLLFVTWAGDTGAYLTGRTLGAHLLCPRVSPAKTIEGSCGGALCSIAIALVCQRTFLGHITLGHCLALSAGINALNQIGDLSESAIKRSFKVKDSGKILPGHGGILDRIDSLLFAAPFLYYYIVLFNR